jgi:hypothetical protein
LKLNADHYVNTKPLKEASKMKVKSSFLLSFFEKESKRTLVDEIGFNSTWMAYWHHY